MRYKGEKDRPDQRTLCDFLPENPSFSASGSEVGGCQNRPAISSSSTDKRLSNLPDGIEIGTICARDPDIASRIKERKAEIDSLNSTAKVLRQQLDRGPARITLTSVRQFGKIIRQNLSHGDCDVRQRIARAFISRIRIGFKVEIEGETAALEHGVAAVARSKGG